MPVDNNPAYQFLGHFVADLDAAVHAGMVVIGEAGFIQDSRLRPAELGPTGHKD